MIHVLLFDFSGVILFPKDKTYAGKLNDLYNDVLKNQWNFLDYYEFNEKLLDFLATVTDRFTLAIFTTEHIQKDPVVKARLGSLFHSILSAHELGLSKKDPHAYIVIAKTLGNKPEEIVFVDDRMENVVAATQAGIKGIQFISTEELFQFFQTI